MAQHYQMLPFERAAVEEEIQGLLLANRWSGQEAHRIALERGISTVSVYAARSRVVQRMSRLRATDLEGERALAMMQLDAVIQGGIASLSSSKPQLAAVVSAVRLKLQALGLLDRPPGESAEPGTGSVGELLEVIERARRLSDSLTAPVVDEDEEPDSDGEE